MAELERKMVMAYIKLIKGKYKTEIRKKGYPFITKRFHTLGDARKFAREVESQMERSVFEDYTGASGATLKEILIKYRDEKTVLKKGVREEAAKINTYPGYPESLEEDIAKIVLSAALSILYPSKGSRDY